MVRTAILNLLNKKISSHLNVDSVWSRKAIMSWCRKNGFVPMTSEKMTLLPEPKWSGIELCSVTSADDLLSTLKEENNSKLVSSDDEEIEIVEVVNKAKQVLNNQTQLQASHIPHLNEAAIYVKEVASQINVNLKPIEIEPCIYAPAIEEMILAACKALASDLIGSAVNEGYNRLGGKLCPEEITVSDVYSTIMKTPQFDFLTN
ncbi:YEATS domain-containing protein 2, partial [Stegodyphus mimosarum]